MLPNIHILAYCLSDSMVNGSMHLLVDDSAIFIGNKIQCLIRDLRSILTIYFE